MTTSEDWRDVPQEPVKLVYSRKLRKVGELCPKQPKQITPPPGWDEPAPDPKLDAKIDAAQILKRLDPKTAEIIRDRYMHDRSISAIAKHHGISRQSVRILLESGLIRLWNLHL